MSESIQIKIFGRKYNVKGDSFSSNSAELLEVASLVDSKMQELSAVGKITSTTDLAILTALNLAREVFEIRKKTGESNKEAESRIDELIGTLEKGVADLKV